MIELYHVSKVYGRGPAALHDVTLTLKKGEFAFLTGPSGAGKTTLLKLLFMAEPATRGQIIMAGRNVTMLPASGIPIMRRNIGVVFQNFRLLNDRTVADNVALPLLVQGIHGAEARRRVNSALELVGLLDRSSNYPPELSGGEQQRAAIARAVVHDPPIVLADEPTGNLDPGLTDSVLELFVRANVRGATILFATHDRELIKRGRQRVISLSKGRVVADVGISKLLTMSWEDSGSSGKSGS